MAEQRSARLARRWSLVAAVLLTHGRAGAQPEQSAGKQKGPQSVYTPMSTKAPDAPKGSSDGVIKESDADPNGAFSTRIDLQVPAYRGLEPKLALVYRSGGGNSLVGVGVSLA